MTCPPNVQCLLTEGQVNEAFLAAPPLMAKSILDLSIKTPSWIMDMPKFSEFPLGQGTRMQQIVFRGEMPQIERGFDKWKKLEDNTGCEPCQTDCAYNITEFGGTGLERKAMQIMARELRSPSYCVTQIQTSFEFNQVMQKIIENLFAQIRFFQEQNVIFNALTSYAKKFVVDSEGPKPNTQNPYVYRRLGTARVSTLNLEMLEYFYEWMNRMTEVVPYDVVDGAPIYSIMASRQLLARLFRDDNQARQDVRFSGLANDLLMKYNFMSTIRGMFIAAPIMYPRRFNITAGTGEPVEVLPWIRGIPMEVGSFTGMNPAYQEATHEEIILNGKFPFEIVYMPTATTLGGNTSFGPEFSWFENLKWVNPLTDLDPLQRVGYFITSAKIGLMPQFSEGLFGILVERPKAGLTAVWLPEPSCPPVPADCENTVPAVGCPCPLILSRYFNKIDGTYIIELSTPTTAEAEDTVQFGIDSGGYVEGTVESVSDDGLTISVTFAEGVDLSTCDRFTTIFCDNTLGCFATVVQYAPVCADSTQLTLVLSNPVKGDVGETVTVVLGNGTQIDVIIVSQDMTKNELVVDVGGTAFCDNVCGVLSVCVPTATDATCPGCGGVTVTYCT